MYPINSCCSHSVWSHAQEMPLCRSVAFAEEDHFLLLPLDKGMIASSTLGQTSRTGLRTAEEDSTLLMESQAREETQSPKAPEAKKPFLQNI